MALQTAIKNLQGEVNNLKAEVKNIKNSGHFGGAGAANKDSRRIKPRWKQEGHAHHSPCWSTTDC